ncbi:hypothetical protein L0B53_14600 [Vibrio sp. SS-MA-C1-2]|uniref:hypothetical protein n=1 Tax=Vibrio sp. SS-MA-C1-2 TaxID=2908646 RepID=UPI001F1965F2|nr:hypothetical protein [Vibrio sp. SS-MA-C1-2]UJF18238.1 hypothetical protein L0B53_14600 [Vibrio sp. SS-MA-C1-2]
MSLTYLKQRQYKAAIWSLFSVMIVVFVCLSKNYDYSNYCPVNADSTFSTSKIVKNDALSSVELGKITENSNINGECHSAEQLINHDLSFLYLAICALILLFFAFQFQLRFKPHKYSVHLYNTSYGVRRHLAFCTFRE